MELLILSLTFYQNYKEKIRKKDWSIKTALGRFVDLKDTFLWYFVIIFKTYFTYCEHILKVEEKIKIALTKEKIRGQILAPNKTFGAIKKYIKTQTYWNEFQEMADGLKQKDLKIVVKIELYNG